MPPKDAPPPDVPVAFGPFHLYPRLRRLERGGESVALGSRALEILLLLAERPGEVVSKRDLIRRVWGEVVVGEGSLRFHIGELRKALGETTSGAPYIQNVAGRGYCFVGDVSHGSLTKPLPVQTTVPGELGKLPARPLRMVGRDTVVRDVSQLLAEWRFVTLVGAGGLGKTTTALAVGHAALERFDVVRFVDLGASNDPRLVPSAVASALGLPVSSADPVPTLIAFLKDKRVLLILDTCERVIEAAATLAEHIVTECPHVEMLASSREPLRAAPERVYALPPLAVPPPETGVRVDEALAFAAVELFVARAQAASPQFELLESNVATVAAMCRKLDGIPLAIELAVGRVSALGLETTAALLNSRFAMKWPGLRTALPRHRTLGATLDWSVELLSESERVVFRRLSVFAGAFTLEAAQKVTCGGLDAVQVSEAVANLVDKSLLSSMSLPTATHFLMLDTTRAYAEGMLADSGEAAAIAHSHAVYLCEFLERTYACTTEFIKPESGRVNAAFLSNLRAALEWARARLDEPALLGRLTAACGPFVLDLSLFDECQRWAEVGLAALDESERGTLREMELQGSLGFSLLFSRGSLQETEVALQRALALAETHRDLYNQTRFLGGLNNFHQRTGELHGALRLARRAQLLASDLNDPAYVALSQWLVGISSHLVGDHQTAITLGILAWNRPPLSQVVNRMRFGFDYQRIRCLCGLARALWIAGHADQACSAAIRVIEAGAQSGHPIALAIPLVWVTPVLFWAGDWSSAEKLSDQLIAHGERHALPLYRAAGLGMKGHLAVIRGDASGGLVALREFDAMLRAANYGLLVAVFATPIAQALAQLGHLGEALERIDAAIAQVEDNGGSFDSPELLRVKGEILATHAEGAAASEAETLFQRSLDYARRQSALAWELRTANSLARLRQQQGRVAEARGVLEPVYSRFREGYGTADLVEARRILTSLA